MEPTVDVDGPASTARPTVETRNSLQTVAQREAESTRVQLRKHHQTSVKKGKFEKHSIELEEVRLPFVDLGLNLLQGSLIRRMAPAGPIVPEIDGQVHRRGRQDPRDNEETEVIPAVHRIAPSEEFQFCSP